MDVDTMHQTSVKNWWDLLAGEVAAEYPRQHDKASAVATFALKAYRIFAMGGHDCASSDRLAQERTEWFKQWMGYPS